MRRRRDAGGGGPTRELPETDPVRMRLEARRGDPGVRWHMSEHTLELAIGALEERREQGRASSKSRRRRRRKRFL